GGRPVRPRTVGAEGPAGPRVPRQGRPGVVGDPDRRAVARLQAGPREGLGGDAGLAGPDVEGVVLDPAGARVVLRELLLGDGHDGAASVEDDRPRARRALVEGEDVALHSFSGSVSLTRA